MNVIKRPVFNTDNLQGIDDVKAALELLEHDLPASRLAGLRNFNKAYLVITTNVRQQLRRGMFEHPDFLMQFDARFASYYFEALRAYIEGQRPPAAWLMAFHTSEQPGASPLLCMTLGVNTHVNNDIPQVLRDLNADTEHYRDFLLVNDIIKDSIYEVVDSIDACTGLINPQKRIFKQLYKWPMKELIKLWRFMAWRRYKQLQRRRMTKASLEEAAQRIGVYMAKLPI